MAFSKQELRRVVKEYPAREVKKGLENLYRKVEKHLCEEENLLQVRKSKKNRREYRISDDLKKCWSNKIINVISSNFF